MLLEFYLKEYVVFYKIEKNIIQKDVWFNFFVTKSLIWYSSHTYVELTNGKNSSILNIERHNKQKKSFILREFTRNTYQNSYTVKSNMAASGVKRLGKAAVCSYWGRIHYIPSPPLTAFSNFSRSLLKLQPTQNFRSF